MLENQEFFLCGGVPLEPVRESFEELLALPVRVGTGLEGVGDDVPFGFATDAVEGEGAEVEEAAALPLALVAVANSEA
jgi:hypothetical protein